MSKENLKSYLVRITAYATVVVVEAENEEKAGEYARNEIRNGDFEVDDTTVEKELKTPEEIERAKAHAQAVALPD